MKSNITNIIYDFDGVIIDSEDIHYQSHKKALLNYGVEITREFYIQNGVAVDNAVFYKKAFKTENLSRSTIKSIKEKKHDYYKYIESKAGLKEISGAVGSIKTLSKQGYKLSVCSAVDRVYITNSLKALKLEEYFDSVITGDDYHIKNKPSPDIYIKAIELLNISSYNCFAIEDSANGAIAAVDAGIACLVLPNNYTKYQIFPKKAIILDSFNEVIEYIKRNTN